MKKQKGFIAENVILFATILTVVGVLIAIPTYVYPKYKVWSQEMEGKAELARAESSRQIATIEARQKMESAEYLNKAEIIRAQGVAEANKIISDGLGGAEGYLRYLWIQGLSEGGNTPQIIYVPTETGLPILEAGKR